MHRRGQRKRDRAGAGFFRHLHCGEHDDKNRTKVREQQLHRKTDIAPGRAAVAELLSCPATK